MARGAHPAAWLMATGFLLLAGPSYAQEAGPWTARIESGPMWIHTDDRSGAGALRVSREVGKSGALALDLGVAASSSLSLEGGVEWKLCPNCRIRPFVGAGAGALGEDDYAGWMVRGNAGIEAPLGRRVVARVGGQLGAHGGQRGPHLLTVALGYRFGRR